MNTINLIGRLAKDPELRHTPGGTPVCTLRLAVTRRKRDGEDAGAVFIDVRSFNGQAEAVAAHLTKGRQVAVSGRLEQDEWTGTDGTPRTRYYVAANQVDFLGSRPANGQTDSSAKEANSDEEPF